MAELVTLDEKRQVEGAKSRAQVMGALAGTAEIGRSILTTPGVPAERLGGAAHRVPAHAQ